MKLRMRFLVAIISLVNGAVAQLGECLLCTEEVRGSSPLSSTRGYNRQNFCRDNRVTKRYFVKRKRGQRCFPFLRVDICPLCYGTVEGSQLARKFSLKESRTLISSDVIAKSKTLALSLILSLLDDFGMATMPCCNTHRIRI